MKDNKMNSPVVQSDVALKVNSLVTQFQSSVVKWFSAFLINRAGSLLLYELQEFPALLGSSKKSSIVNLMGIRTCLLERSSSVNNADSVSISRHSQGECAVFGFENFGRTELGRGHQSLEAPFFRVDPHSST